jgi:hypothetical protein
MPVFIVIPLVAFKRGGLLAWHAQGALQTRFFRNPPMEGEALDMPFV